MTIQYLNHSSFLIKVKTNGNSLTKILIDPFDDSIGVKFKSTEADIVLISHMHNDHNNIAGVKNMQASDLNNDTMGALSDKPFVIKTAGEFEVNGVMIKGIQSFHDNSGGSERGPNTIFTITINDLTVCHLGDLGHKLDKDQIEKLGSVDALMVPVGGVFTIGPETAAEVVSQIEPSVVVPMHFKSDKHSDMYADLKTVEDFKNELGEADVKAKDELTVTKSSSEETELVVLKPQYT
jgi:L-ascorbate metabolism protein UlaG (beta-lactamase superfamily)